MSEILNHKDYQNSRVVDLPLEKLSSIFCKDRYTLDYPSDLTSLEAVVANGHISMYDKLISSYRFD